MPLGGVNKKRRETKAHCATVHRRVRWHARTARQLGSGRNVGYTSSLQFSSIGLPAARTAAAGVSSAVLP